MGVTPLVPYYNCKGFFSQQKIVSNSQACVFCNFVKNVATFFQPADWQCVSTGGEWTKLDCPVLHTAIEKTTAALFLASQWEDFKPQAKCDGKPFKAVVDVYINNQPKLNLSSNSPTPDLLLILGHFILSSSMKTGTHDGLWSWKS